MGTVSNTINHPELVRKNTRQLVERAIRELGFVPNQHARVLTGASSQVIGLVVLDVVSPFFMQAARAVERAAQEAGHVVILCNSDNDSKKESRILQMLTAQRVRGALLTPAATTGAKPKRPPARRLPTVFLDYQDSTDDCSVAVDDVAGGRLAAQHLLDLGHQRVAFVGGGRGIRQHSDRVRGGRQAMSMMGLDPTSALVEVREPGLGIQDGVLAAQRLIEQGKLPSGILCGNDMIAFGVYRGLSRAGIRVPGDVALVGYDDIDFAADWVVPLTSVRQPTDHLGYMAAQLLLEHSAGDAEHQHRQIMLQPELIARNSSDPSYVAMEHQYLGRAFS